MVYRSPIAAALLIAAGPLPFAGSTAQAATLLGDTITIDYFEVEEIELAHDDSATVLVVDDTSPEFENTVGSETYQVFVDADQIVIRLTNEGDDVWSISGGALHWRFSDLDFGTTGISGITVTESGMDPDKTLTWRFTPDSVEVIICPECRFEPDGLNQTGAPFELEITVELESDEPDTDGDGVFDSEDLCPLDSPDDSDGDGQCDTPATIEIEGTCPGSVTFDLAGFTPSGTVAMLTGSAPGGDVYPGGPCVGASSGLADLGFVTTVTVDASGGATLTPVLPGAACGLWVQALNLWTCTQSAATEIP